MTSCMTLCEIQNDGLVLIYYLNNSTRGNFIIPSQEETIANLEILDQVGSEGRFWLSGTIRGWCGRLKWTRSMIETSTHEANSGRKNDTYFRCFAWFNWNVLGT